MISSEPDTCSSIKLSLTESPRKIALFLRVLICFSLYYVDENMLTSAIIYTFLDFLLIIALIVGIFWFNNNFELSILIFRRCFGIKSILDPGRFWFKGFKGGYEPWQWNTIVQYNSLFTIWYSLLGIIFSSIFITSDFSCNESCDQFDDRISRFRAFFIFSLVINILAFIYSYTSGCFAIHEKKTFFKLVVSEEQKEKEETNV